MRKCPNLAVIVYANTRDHVQADPAHTHILEQVEGFRKAGARFVRWNPDRAYAEYIVPPGLRRTTTLALADNPAGRVWTRANVAEGLEPVELPAGLYMQAAVCELANRTQADNGSPNLAQVLCPDVSLPPGPPGSWPQLRSEPNRK